MIGRLKPGISPAQAKATQIALRKEIMRGYPADMANLHINALVRPLQNDTVQQSRSLLRTLFLAVAVVLLIACFNLAGLMLVRAIRRQREVAVRLALGSPAWALIRQAVLESLVLSVSGGVLGLILAGIRVACGQKPASRRPCRASTKSRSAGRWSLLRLGWLWSRGSCAPWLLHLPRIRTNVNSNLKGRRSHRKRRRRPCTPAFHARGCRNRDCAGAARCIGPSAAQLRQNARCRPWLHAATRDHCRLFVAPAAILRNSRRSTPSIAN